MYIGTSHTSRLRTDLAPIFGDGFVAAAVFAIVVASWMLRATPAYALRFPDGELRALWFHSIRSNDPEEGRAEIREWVRKAKYAGFNTLFLWGSSLYMAALSEQKYRVDVPEATWDAYGEFVAEASKAGIDVHLWYSPWGYKNRSRAVELREHADWSQVNLEGKPTDSSVCPTRPEVRDFEIGVILQYLNRYPDLKGVHLEEPGYNWGDFCFCEPCRNLGKLVFGLDIREKPEHAGRSHLKAFICTDFVARLRETLKNTNPHLLLSANGSDGPNPDWYIGRDWASWARRGYLDFYVPQVYQTNTDAFIKAAKESMSVVGDCVVCPGIAITYSAIRPRRNTREELVRQVEVARELGAGGVVVFCAAHMTTNELEAFSCVLPHP